MAEDSTASRMHPDDLAALQRALLLGPPRLAVPPSEVPTGLDSRVVREAVAELFRQGAVLDSRQIDERIARALGDRRGFTDAEIRAIAKEVAHTVFDDLIAPMEGDVAKFLTEQQIEGVIVRKLRECGVRADEKSIEETRETIEGMIRGYRRRAEIGNSFVLEIVKGLAIQITGGGIIVGVAAIAWKAMSAGGAHP